MKRKRKRPLRRVEKGSMSSVRNDTVPVIIESSITIDVPSIPVTLRSPSVGLFSPVDGFFGNFEPGCQGFRNRHHQQPPPFHVQIMMIGSKLLNCLHLVVKVLLRKCIKKGVQQSLMVISLPLAPGTLHLNPSSLANDELVPRLARHRLWLRCKLRKKGLCYPVKLPHYTGPMTIMSVCVRGRIFC
ncbi:hypothetical protein L6452_29698 [Arctium lappa]|uniref:Uncharacterized protein n=1 Tax=Arctium lappa TaxID=4217 RepID=A0ACB8ZGR6_ARCLA|nr:hypothetical protein L6452_29698 [Arctium lappa]